MPEMVLSKRTYNRCQKTVREIKEFATSEIAGPKGDKIYGLADRLSALLDRLVCEIEMENRRNRSN